MSRSDVRIGRIAGVPIHIDWTVIVLVWLLGSALIGRVVPAADPTLGPLPRLALGLGGALAFLGSVLAHEVGHAVVARRGGVPVEGISLWLFGGVARMASDSPRPGLAVRIAAAGPAVSLAIGVGGLLLGRALDAADLAPAVAAVAAWLGGINLLLAAFNLLPGLPLDGGRVLEGALWARWGDRDRAVRAAGGAGRALGYALVGLGAFELLRGGTFAGVWLGAIGFFLASAARSEAAGQQARRALAGLRVGQVMSPGVAEAPSYLTVGEFLEGHARHGRGDLWTVRSWGGELEGTVSVRRLSRLPRDRMAVTHLREVAVPIAEAPWAGADELVLEVLARSANGDPVLVVADQQLVGVLGPDEVERAIRWRQAATQAARPAA